MMHFMRNLHDYVASQVLEISWLEFQDNLLNKVTCLDELIMMHEKYLNRALFRCLLNPKAAPVMKADMETGILWNSLQNLPKNCKKSWIY